MGIIIIIGAFKLIKNNDKQTAFHSASLTSNCKLCRHAGLNRLRTTGFSYSPLNVQVNRECHRCNVCLFPQVHSKYRRTGASFTKAQQEFSQGVLSNRTVQTVAADAATSAAQGAIGRSRGN